MMTEKRKGFFLNQNDGHERAEQSIPSIRTISFLDLQLRPVLKLNVLCFIKGIDNEIRNKEVDYDHTEY